MEIYILNLGMIGFWALLLYLLNQHDTKKGRLIFLIVTAIQLILLQGLRSISVGADTNAYINIYEQIKILDWNGILELRYEIGFKLFNKTLAMLGISAQVYLSVISALIIIPIIITIYKYSTNIYLSIYFYITLGFYGASFNTL